VHEQFRDANDVWRGRPRPDERQRDDDTVHHDVHDNSVDRTHDDRTLSQPGQNAGGSKKDRRDDERIEIVETESEGGCERATAEGRIAADRAAGDELQYSGWRHATSNV